MASQLLQSISPLAALGVAAEHWLSRLSWLGLAAGLAAGLAVSLLIRRQVARPAEQRPAPEPAGDGPAHRQPASRTGPAQPAGALDSAMTPRPGRRGG